MSNGAAHRRKFLSIAFLQYYRVLQGNRGTCPQIYLYLYLHVFAYVFCRDIGREDWSSRVMSATTANMVVIRPTFFAKKLDLLILTLAFFFR